jgi:hypothetical protein
MAIPVDSQKACSGSDLALGNKLLNKNDQASGKS